MKNLKKQNGLRLPSHFLKDTGLDQERSLLAALFPSVILLTRRFPSPQEREEIGEGLSCVARDLDLPLGAGGLVIPDEMLEDAGLPRELEQLEFFVEDGRIVLEAQTDFEQELLADAWEEAEEDEILSRLPRRLRDFFRDLKIHPATVRDVMLRGGVEECFAVRGIRLMEGKNGPFLSFPSYKAKDGYQDICFPLNGELRRQMTEAAVDAYHQALEQHQTRQEEPEPAPEMAM